LYCIVYCTVGRLYGHMILNEATAAYRWAHLFKLIGLVWG